MASSGSGTREILSTPVMDYSSMNLPKLIAFDLDGTIWTPDMYQLWGGGAPFRLASNGKDLLDRVGTVVKLLGLADRILHDLSTHPALSNIKVAWVSCTDEPEWAAECLQRFKTSGGEPIETIVHSSQIFKANKQFHFRNLKKEYPGIQYQDMLFFDNECGNIESVAKLGVKCYFARTGMTAKAWEEGLMMFA
jgi:magnesium-dependent phosphatase 1